MGHIRARVYIICAVILVSFLSGAANRVYAASDTYTAEEVYDAGMDIVAWAASESEDELFSEEFCQQAGTSANDWLVIGLCSLVPETDVADYLQSLKAYVEEMYSDGNLENKKATEWHRISLVVMAAGEDPTCFGTTEDGSEIDLIADGSYMRGEISPLGRQGLNGWCFALISFDASGVEIPDDAYYSREEMIDEILSCQLESGGFALYDGASADVDITAMAIQALAPYYENYADEVDKALEWLSSTQLENGDFSSYGTANAESTAQVIIALTSLGIDPQTDQRFIKNDCSVLDGLMRYQMTDGGFSHALDTSTNEGTSNALASAQSLLALAAIYRQMNGEGALYSFDTKIDETESESEIDQTEDEIAASGDEAEQEEYEDSSIAADEEEENSWSMLYIVITAVCLAILGFFVYFMRKGFWR